LTIKYLPHIGTTMTVFNLSTHKQKQTTTNQRPQKPDITTFQTTLTEQTPGKPPRKKCKKTMRKSFKTMIKTALNHVKIDPDPRAEKPKKHI